MTTDRASIAHSLRNILNAVLSNAESILQTSAADSPNARHAQAIQRAVARAADLIAQLKSPEPGRTQGAGDPAASMRVTVTMAASPPLAVTIAGVAAMVDWLAFAPL